MEKLKSNLQNMVLVLVSISVICGGILAFVNDSTSEAIKAQDDLALANGIKKVLNADEVKVEDTDTIPQDFGGKELTFIMYKTDKGVAVQSTDPNGFGGDLGVLVGFDKEGTILGYTVLVNNETPGLGAKAPEWFQKGQKGDIIGKVPGKDGLKVTKDDGEVEAITASTITSRAFLRAINNAYMVYMASVTGNCEADANTSATEQHNNN